MLIDRVSLLPPIDNAHKMSQLEAKNAISKLGSIKDESFKNMLIRSIASRYEIHDIEDVQKVANTQAIKAMQNLDNLQKIQNMQQIQKIEQIQKVQNMQQIQNIRQIQNVQELIKTHEINEISIVNNLEQFKNDRILIENILKNH